MFYFVLGTYYSSKVEKAFGWYKTLIYPYGISPFEFCDENNNTPIVPKYTAIALVINFKKKLHS